MTDLGRFEVRPPARAPGLAGPVAGLVALSVLNLGVIVVAGSALAARFPALDALGLAVGLNVAFSTLAAGLLWATGGWSFGHARLGACNAVTHLRGALVCLLAMPLAAPSALADPALCWALFFIGLIALSLDGVDGWLARRAGLQSAFGARFDMETDSLLALVLATLAWSGGAAGPAVMVLGLARYVFWGASGVWPALAAPLPDRVSRKAVCVVQLATLLALQAPVMPAMAGHVLAAGAALLLAWSFARDIRWLAARAP